MYELLEKVLKPYGPSGNEEAVARTIRQALEGHVDSIETDVMGNLIAIKKGTNPNGKKVMFSAHMDHIGFIVTGFEKEGFLRVTNVGGVSPDSNQFRHVTFGNGVQGVVVSQPLKPGESRAMKHMFIDIGAQDKAEAEKMVKLGDVAVYAPNVVRLGEHRVASPAMDDRSACAVLLQFLLQAGTYADTIIGVFSVQEEVGCRGAKTASFALAPDVGIALDVTAWGDTPEVDQPAVALGKGIAVKVMDRASISNPALRDQLMGLAEKRNIPYQREVLAFGGTDAGSMQTSRGGIPVCTLSIPCRYVHSALETVDLRDMEAGVQLMLAYMEDGVK